MGLPASARFSVRGIAWAGFAALALLCLAVAGGVAYVAVQLQSTSAALVRDAESLRLITQVELQLLDFQRLSTFTDDSQAQIQLQALREDLQATLAQALLHAADPAEADSIEQTAADIQAYMNSRDALIASGADPLSIPRLARPALSVALQGLEVLSDMNRNEVTRAYASAQRVGFFFILAAAATAILTAAILWIMATSLRRMLLRPILEIRNAIDRFRSGEANPSADERAPRELSEIARAFNEMSTELGRQKAQQLAFIAGVAHDLRNPLMALQFGVDVMQRDDASKSEADTVTLISRQLAHLTRMVDDLLETCAIEAGELALKPSSFDLRETVRSVVDLYRPVISSRPIDLELCETPAPVHADRTRMEQVVGNLLSNAIKYSSAESPIRLRVSTLGPSHLAEISVTDSGIGIDAEELEQIFRPFWRAGGSGDRSGTGLGLSVVRKIVVAHGGSVDVESRPGLGSVFRVQIPLRTMPQREAG